MAGEESGIVTAMGQFRFLAWVFPYAPGETKKEKKIFFILILSSMNMKCLYIYLVLSFTSTLFCSLQSEGSIKFTPF